MSCFRIDFKMPRPLATRRNELCTCAACSLQTRLHLHGTAAVTPRRHPQSPAKPSSLPACRTSKTSFSITLKGRKAHVSTRNASEPALFFLNKSHLQALEQLPGRRPLARLHRPALLHQGPQLLRALRGVRPRLLARHEAVQDLRGVLELVEWPLAAAQIEPS